MSIAIRMYFFKLHPNSLDAYFLELILQKQGQNGRTYLFVWGARLCDINLSLLLPFPLIGCIKGREERKLIASEKITSLLQTLD